MPIYLLPKTLETKKYATIAIIIAEEYVPRLKAARSDF